MADGEMGEKTEQPTARKMTQARRNGQVAKSTDLNAAVGFAAMTLIFAFLGGGLLMNLGMVMRAMLGTLGSPDAMSAGGILAAAKIAFGTGITLVLPILFLYAGAIYAIQYFQVGWLWTTKPVKPKLSNLQPTKGLKRIFGMKNAVKSVMNIIKVSFVIWVAVAVLTKRLGDLTAATELSARVGMYIMGEIALELALYLLLVLIIIAVLDYIYQKWKHIENLKMTKQEVKDERKAYDGDPKTKRKQREMGYKIAMGQMKIAVPEADVIVTNPTHFSVAIKYDRGTMAAPTVTAKGADEMALRIRFLARQYGVPIVERAPLARALFWGVEVGGQVRTEHYEAVAEVLAYVYRLDGRAEQAAAQTTTSRSAPRSTSRSAPRPTPRTPPRNTATGTGTTA